MLTCSASAFFFSAWAFFFSAFRLFFCTRSTLRFITTKASRPERKYSLTNSCNIGHRPLLRLSFSGQRLQLCVAFSARDVYVASASRCDRIGTRLLTNLFGVNFFLCGDCSTLGSTAFSFQLLLALPQVCGRCCNKQSSGTIHEAVGELRSNFDLA